MAGVFAFADVVLDVLNADHIAAQVAEEEERGAQSSA